MKTTRTLKDTVCFVVWPNPSSYGKAKLLRDDMGLYLTKGEAKARQADLARLGVSTIVKEEVRPLWV
jgi:hypothetical protein